MGLLVLHGRRVGELNKAMSGHIKDLVDLAGHARAAVCRAVLKGSTLRADVVFDVARSGEVTSTRLDSVAELHGAKASDSRRAVVRVGQ